MGFVPAVFTAPPAQGGFKAQLPRASGTGRGCSLPVLPPCGESPALQPAQALDHGIGVEQQRREC